MSLQTEQAVALVDAQQKQLGQVEIERREGDLLLGRFLPGPGFATVARLFRDFEEAANGQSLGVVERLDAAIAALGLTLRLSGSRSVDVRDVQIWSDGGFTCRLRDPAETAVNGRIQRAQPGEAAAQ